MAGLPW